MRFRVLQYLLIPCLVLTQSVALLGTAHADECIVGHHHRPHVHTTAGHHCHADHDHEPQSPNECEPIDHDGDAVYFTNADSFNSPRTQLLTHLVYADAGVDFASSMWATLRNAHRLIPFMMNADLDFAPHCARWIVHCSLVI